MTGNATTVDVDVQWWEEAGGFFGSLDKEADDSARTFFGDTAELDECTLAEVDGVVRLCELDKGAKVVDCACGHGRQSVELAVRGYDVVGVDINSTYRGLAAQQASERGARLSLRHGDMRALPTDLGGANAVINE